MRTCSLLLCLSALFLASGCANNIPEPQVASSAAQPAYASGFPSSLQAVAKELDETETNLRKFDANLSGYPGELTDPNWEVVVKVTERSEQAGRSHAYREARRSVRAQHGFFEQEGPELTKKVAGTAQYVVKQKGCDVDVTGPISHALKDNVDKTLEKRMRAANDGQSVVESYRETLGKKNAAALEKQSDEIAEASYLANIGLVEQKLELRRLLADAEAVKKAIPDAMAAERAFQAESGRTDAEKQASHQRLEGLQRAQTELESSINAARKLDENIEKRIADARKAHDEAFQKHLADLRNKKR